MSKKELTEAAKRQQASGKTLVRCVLVFVGLYAMLVVPLSFVTRPFTEAIKIITAFFLVSLSLMSPTLLAALLQYIVRPGWMVSITRWIGGIWLIFASLGIAFVMAAYVISHVGA